MKGILVIAHGSSKAEWLQLVDDMIKDISLDSPILVSFLEMVPEWSIEIGVNALRSLGVTELMVIPLFVCSGSTHIDEIKEIFNLSEDPLMKNAILTAPMDDHPIIINLLNKRIQEFNVSLKNRSIVLIGHGSKVSGYKEKWDNVLGSISEKLSCKLNKTGEILCTTLYSENKLETFLKASQPNKMIIIPLFLSTGYFTNTIIPRTLKDFDYVYSGKAYLPDGLIKLWILSNAYKFAEDSDKSKQRPKTISY